jgi:hypothetical protein
VIIPWLGTLRDQLSTPWCNTLVYGMRFLPFLGRAVAGKTLFSRSGPQIASSLPGARTVPSSKATWPCQVLQMFQMRLLLCHTSSMRGLPYNDTAGQRTIWPVMGCSRMLLVRSAMPTMKLLITSPFCSRMRKGCGIPPSTALAYICSCPTRAWTNGGHVR